MENCTLEQREKLIAEFVEMGCTADKIEEFMKDPIKLRILNALAARL